MLALVSIACWIPQTRLSEPLPVPVVGAVQGVGFAETGTRLVFVADSHVQGELRLFSAPLDASAPALQLSPGSLRSGAPSRSRATARGSRS